MGIKFLHITQVLNHPVQVRPKSFPKRKALFAHSVCANLGLNAHSVCTREVSIQGLFPDGCFQKRSHFFVTSSTLCGTMNYPRLYNIMMMAGPIGYRPNCGFFFISFITVFPLFKSRSSKKQPNFPPPPTHPRSARRVPPEELAVSNG